MTHQLKSRDIIALGFMTFALFVGAGNIIFPPMVGLQAGEHVWTAAIGFLITAVGLPVLTVVALAGAVLLLWPGGDGKTAERASPQAAALVEAELQQEMEDILGRIQGVGEVQVLLTVESDGERQLAQDSELSYSGSTAAPEDYSRSSQTVLVDDGSAEAPVVTRTVYPTYRGALVVCQGGDRADVKLAVTEAVAALTGLSADRITVAKSQ